MYGAKYVGNLFGSAQPQVTKFQLTASETITKGDLVDLTSGLVNEATAAKAFLGIANETVTDSGSGTDYIDIIVARPGDVYLMDNDQDSDTFAVTDIEHIINKLFSGFDYIYCLLSTTTGYLDSIIELLFNHASFVIKSGETGSGSISRSWGRILKEALMSQVYSPGDVEKIANENNCKMIDSIFFKK